MIAPPVVVRCLLLYSVVIVLCVFVKVKHFANIFANYFLYFTDTKTGVFSCVRKSVLLRILRAAPGPGYEDHRQHRTHGRGRALTAALEITGGGAAAVPGSGTLPPGAGRPGQEIAPAAGLLVGLCCVLVPAWPDTFERLRRALERLQDGR